MGGLSCILSLLTLGIGYLVFLHGTKEKSVVKLLGLGIGIFLMIAAILAMMCPNMCPTKKMCGVSKGGMCPVKLKAPAQEAQ